MGTRRAAEAANGHGVTLVPPGAAFGFTRRLLILSPAAGPVRGTGAPAGGLSQVARRSGDDRTAMSVANSSLTSPGKASNS